MASGEGAGCSVRTRDRRYREDEGDANHLWVVEVAEVETRSEQVLGMTVDRLQGCWMGAQVRKV